MLAIDTLKLAQDLKKGGFTEEQTATLVDLGRDLSNQALEKVATKDDLKALEERIDDKFEGVAKDMTALEERLDLKFYGLRKETKADLTVAIAKLQTEMYKAMGVQTLALLGLGFALFKLFG